MGQRLSRRKENTPPKVKISFTYRAQKTSIIVEDKPSIENINMMWYIKLFIANNIAQQFTLSKQGEDYES